MCEFILSTSVFKNLFRRGMLRIGAIFLSLFLFSCQTAEMAMQEKGIQPLTGNELTKLVSGKTAYGKDPYGNYWHEYMDANGNAYFKYRGKSLKVGYWEVKDNEICFLYTDSNSKIPFCFNYFLDGTQHRTIFTTTSKKGSWGDTIIEYKEGDAEGLTPD